MEPHLPSDDAFVLGTFLQRYLEDLAAGRALTTEGYTRLFPGYEELIHQEMGKLVAPQSGALGKDVDEPAPGALRVSHYRLDRMLGRGGQGCVWLAHDVRLHRKVALKLLSGVGPGGEEILARFHREAEIASRLDHPNICSVYDAGIADGTAFIAMRHVEGETLALKITKARSKPASSGSKGVDLGPESGSDTAERPAHPRDAVESIVQLFEQAAHALHAAHECGILHRDIKPGNIMVTPRGAPVILDFGLARDASTEHPTLTRPGDVFGTPAYMAPEQLRSAHAIVDRRTDVWALGASLFESLTLERPFDGATREALYEAVLLRDVPKVRRLNPAVPRDLEIVVETALEKSQDRRYQSALAFAEDLQRVREMRPIAAKPIGRLARAARWARRRPAAAGLIGALALLLPLLAGVGGYLIANWEGIATQKQESARQAREARLEQAFFDRVNWDLSSALAAYSNLLKDDPDSAEVRAGLAMTHLRSREPERALALLDERPDLVKSWVGLAHIRVAALDMLHRNVEATNTRRDLPEPATSDDCALVAMALGELAAVDGRTELAKPAFRYSLEAVVRRRQAPRLLYHLCVAVHAAWAREDAMARRAGETLVDLWPESERAWLGKAMSRRGDDAIAVFEQCLQRWPDSFSAHLGIASTLGRKDPGRACKHIVQALALRPDNPTAHRIRGLLLLSRTDHAGAIAELHEAIRLGSDGPHAYLALATALREQGDLGGALEQLNEALIRTPTLGVAYGHIGSILALQGKPQESLAAYRAAVAASPLNPWCRLWLAQALFARDDRSGAIAQCDAAIHAEPYDEWVFGELRSLLEAQGERDRAVRIHEKALQRE